MFDSQIYYKVVSPDGSNFIDRTGGAACFNGYSTVPANFTRDKTIKIFLTKKESKNVYNQVCTKPFTLEQIQIHSDGLTEAGMINKVEETGTHFIISANEWDYLNLSHYRIGLDYFRAIQEIGIYELVKEYFLLPEGIRNKYDYFTTLQALFIWLRSNRKCTGGHGLPCYGWAYIGLLSGQEIIEYLYGTKHQTGSREVYKEILEKRYKSKANAQILPPKMQSYKISDFDKIVSTLK